LWLTCGKPIIDEDGPEQANHLFTRRVDDANEEVGVAVMTIRSKWVELCIKQLSISTSNSIDRLIDHCTGRESLFFFFFSLTLIVEGEKRDRDFEARP
jgi:hypothetical protein